MLGALLALGVGACTPHPDNPMPDAAVPDAAAPPTAIVRGEAVAKKYNCGTCHNPEKATDGILSGQMSPRPMTMAYGANLTPDKDTGILDWTDDDIITAVRTGIDDEGDELCLAMPRFKTMGDGDAHDLVAYLRSLKAVNRTIPDSMCPPIKPKPMDGGTHD
jgi:mono/diheme cytochrome c family protein